MSGKESLRAMLERLQAKAQADVANGYSEHHFVFRGMGIDINTGNAVTVYECTGCGQPYVAGAHRSIEVRDVFGDGGGEVGP